MKRVTLYTKPGCHLCDAVKHVIDRVRRGVKFDLEIRDISEHAADHARYWDSIPVVLVDGSELARYRLTEAELRAALRA
jgi:glutaredoxin